MQRALELAEQAEREGEVPVGAVVTRGDVIVGESGNAMRSASDPTAHAEIQAIRAAASKLATSRLDKCTLWVTLEPCTMCAGAIALARIGKVVFAADDPKGGGVLHGPRVFAQPTCHHRPEVISGIGSEQAALLLKDFFRSRR